MKPLCMCTQFVRSANYQLLLSMYYHRLYQYTNLLVRRRHTTPTVGEQDYLTSNVVSTLAAVWFRQFKRQPAVLFNHCTG